MIKRSQPNSSASSGKSAPQVTDIEKVPAVNIDDARIDAAGRLDPDEYDITDRSELKPWMANAPVVGFTATHRETQRRLIGFVLERKQPLVVDSLASVKARFAREVKVDLAQIDHRTFQRIEPTPWKRFCAWVEDLSHPVKAAYIFVVAVAGLGAVLWGPGFMKNVLNENSTGHGSGGSSAIAAPVSPQGHEVATKVAATTGAAQAVGTVAAKQQVNDTPSGQPLTEQSLEQDLDGYLKTRLGAAPGNTASPDVVLRFRAAPQYEWDPVSQTATCTIDGGIDDREGHILLAGKPVGPESSNAGTSSDNVIRDACKRVVNDMIASYAAQQ